MCQAINKCDEQCRSKCSQMLPRRDTHVNQKPGHCRKLAVQIFVENSQSDFGAVKTTYPVSTAKGISSAVST